MSQGATTTAPRGRRNGPATPGVSSAAHTRAYVAIGVLTFALFGIAVRAWGLQVGSGDLFRDQAARQHAITVEIPAPRGAIVDRLGRPLALTADADSIWADPREVRDVAATAEKLATLLDGDVRLLEEKLGSERRFIWLARKIQPEVAAAVRAAKLPGIVVSSEPHRYYPARSVGGTLIGRANIDGHGIDGIELMMDKLLSGQRSRIAGLRDARGRALLSDGLTPATPGAQVQLTIDQTIQAIAEAALAETMQSAQAKSGVVVVLDVATSEVLGMASAPSFDPNEVKADQPAASRSRAVADAYEIGSIMKLFNVAAALDAGVTTPDELFDTEGGSWKLGPKTIRDVHHDFQLTTSEIIKRSSNIGSAKLALRLGRDRLSQGLRQFGFGKRTGIELPGEQSGLLRDAKSWRDIELATISYGYGLTVTPLQVAAGVAAIGNRGVWHAPRIVRKVTTDLGEVLPRPEAPAFSAIRPETAAKMLPMMASVFDGGAKAGTANKVVVDGFRCGGKSGTAHKLDPVTKTYALSKKYLSSFAGLAPIDSPRLAILVLIDEPSGGDYFGGKIAGPVFAKVASESLRYLGVPGDAPLPAPLRMPGIPGVPVAAAGASQARAASGPARPSGGSGQGLHP